MTKLKLRYTLMIQHYSVREKNIESSQKTLQKEYDLLCECFKINKMQINAKKTKVMVFGTKRMIKNQVMKIRHDNNFLENVSDFKYLGVILVQNLNWSLHLSKRKKIGLLRVYEGFNHT